MEKTVLSIDAFLAAMAERGASDLHLTTGSPPVIRVNGRLERLPDRDDLVPDDIRTLVYRILSTEQQKLLETKRQFDFSYSLPGVARFRVNAYYQRTSLGAAFRMIPTRIKTLETIATALTAAETGHLVFATLHTQSAPQTIDRVIDAFPAEQQQQVRVQLAATLQGVVTQNLVPTADRRGRTAALEILMPDDAVRNLIRQAKIEQIDTVMQTGSGP